MHNQSKIPFRQLASASLPQLNPLRQGDITFRKGSVLPMLNLYPSVPEFMGEVNPGLLDVKERGGFACRFKKESMSHILSFSWGNMCK